MDMETGFVIDLFGKGRIDEDGKIREENELALN